MMTFVQCPHPISNTHTDTCTHMQSERGRTLTHAHSDHQTIIINADTQELIEHLEAWRRTFRAWLKLQFLKRFKREDGFIMFLIAPAL